jgi:chromosome segregation protein
MRLKNVVIQGFKSFSDKAVVELQSGLTGIVGPNGCGKSNVVDAIRWVMGEQSPRSLRGSEMMDVLFGGTERRAPGGVAKVQMLLEREEESGPFQEIEVTRKLSRAGESQYFLNRARCRLRDVSELLMEARLGLRDYAIIEQGKIDRVLSLKPQERLQIFEEAAGVRRFHVQRERTEAKLAQALENLERVADIHAEVQRQCSRLGRQAAAAKRYLELAHELDRARTRLYLVRRERLELRRAEVEAELDALARSERELAAAAAELHAELASTEEALQIESRGRGRAETELRTAESALRAAETEHALLTESEPRLAEQQVATEGELQRLAERDAELCDALLATSAEEMELSERLEASGRGLASAQEELARRREEVQQGAEASAAARERFVGLHARHASATGERKRLEEAFERDERNHRRLAKSLQEVADEERRLAETRSDLERRHAVLGEQLAAADEESAVQQERHALAAGRVRSGRHELHELEKRIEGLSARRRTLEELVLAMEGVSDGPRAVVQWARARGERPSLLLQALDIPPDLEPALTAALGERLEAVVAPNLRWALEAIDTLGDELPPTGFAVRELLPETPFEAGSLPAAVRWLPGADPRLAALLAQYRLVPDREAALLALAGLEPGRIVVTERGETFEGTGLLTAGTARSRAGGALRRVQEARRLREQLAVDSARRDQLSADLAGAEQEMHAAETTLGELQARRRSLLAEQGRQGAEIERLGYAVERLELDRAAAEQQLAQLGAQLGAVREDIEALLAETRALEQGIAGAEEAERAAAERLEAARERVRCFEEDELLARRLEARSLGEQLKALAARAVELQQRRAETLSESERRRRELASGAERLAGMRSRIGELSARRAELAEGCAVLRLRLEEASERTEGAEKQVSGHRDRIEALHARRGGLLEAQGAARVRLAECRVGLDALGELRASLPAALPEALGEMEHLEPEQLEPVIAELERRQKGLGTLNFAAIEELDAARERFELLLSQKTDLERSVQDLQEAIVQLTRRAGSQFEDAFEAIRQNFRELFARVLEGGRADLVLLRSGAAPGVDIQAQPPGKRVRSLELLSGGEKALVTILLLVAMFLYRPSSFCILDEVDAPLDDVNNRRYVELLQQIARTTQVLVVTHSKRTIEACDTLYGVTMDEPGVSKLVSVRLHGRRGEAPELLQSFEQRG